MLRLPQPGCPHCRARGALRPGLAQCTWQALVLYRVRTGCRLRRALDAGALPAYHVHAYLTTRHDAYAAWWI